MSKLDDQLTEQFFRWEMRGRGWRVFDQPVALEPPFRPFAGHFVPRLPLADDGRRHTRVSGFLDRLRREIAPEPEPAPAQPEEEPEPDYRRSSEPSELQLSLPLSRSVPAPQVEQFLRHACRPGESLAFEILGTERETVPQFVAPPGAAARVRRAVEACFPGIVPTPSPSAALSEAWSSDLSLAAIELGLGGEFMLPLGNPRCDMLAAVASAMDGLWGVQFALMQVLFEPARNAWRESIMAAVTDGEGAPFFANRRDLVSGAERKVASPLYGVVIRLAAGAEDLQRAWEIVAEMAAPLSALSRSGSNYLVPLGNDDYPADEHEEDILNRESRRSGMLLSMDELISLVTPPTTSASRKLRRETKRTNAAPEILAGGTLSLGTNPHGGAAREVFLSPEHRVRHLHAIGASGTGKSTFLLNLIRQDIERGEGVAVLDPHGDLVDAILGSIPPERRGDVVLLDPSDESHSVGLNILAAHSDFERSLLASDLTSVFRRLSTSWGDQMESVLRNGILAFLESSRGGTLADLRRFLLDASFRKEFLGTVTDPEIVYYWRRAFPQLSGGKSIGPIMTRLDEFLSRKPIRYMVSQSDNRLDFADILDGGRILLAKLSQGLIGRENTALLGSLITAKLQMAAMSRQRMPAARRRDFWCYMDEFQHFITPSMAEILSGARKYRLGLVLAHQELRHLEADRDVASAVLSNCYTRAVFKVGDADARALESGFSHFEARDLMNLGIGEAVCRVERSDFDFNLTVPNSEHADDSEAAAVRAEVTAMSRAKYARPRAEIEAELMRSWRAEEDGSAGRAEPRAKSKAASEAPKAAPAESPAAEPKPPVPAPTDPEEKPAPPAEAKPAVQESPPEASEAAVPASPAAPIAAPTTAEEEPAPIRVPKDLGRGGAQHQAIQQRLKVAAEGLGFRATIERETGTRQGSIDLALERTPHRIACEISISTTIDHEVGNVSKCIKAGYPAVAVVCTEADRLAKIEAAVTNSLGPDAAAKTKYFLPDQFLENLAGLPNEIAPGVPKEEMRRGRKVKRNIVQLSPEEIRAREQEALKLIRENLQRRH